MNEFIQSLPAKLAELKAAPEREVTLVLGNDSCDLDSAVCALVLAHHLNSTTGKLTLPILNIPKEDVALKTEVEYCVGKELISKLPTRDDIDFEKLTNFELVLVDHHKVVKDLDFLVPKISRVLDHRTLDQSATFPPGCNINLQLVGSCATLVAEEILKEGYKDLSGLALLRSTIIADTVNFAPDKKKFADLDKQIIAKIEEELGLSNDEVNRQEIFEAIDVSKGRTEGFTIHQLIRKDMKMLALGVDNIKTAVSSTYPYLAQELCSKETEIQTTLEDFLKKYKVQLLIIIGLNKTRDAMDILLFRSSSSENSILVKLVDAIVDALCQRQEIQIRKNPQFNKIIADCQATHLTQANTTFTRKKLLPIMMQGALSASV